MVDDNDGGAADHPSDYAVLDPEEAERTESEKSSSEHVDLTEGLGLTELRGRVWYLEPGHDRKRTHVHETQEELYHVMSGPGRMTVGGDTVDVPEGAFVRVPPETPRRLFNDTDEEHVWLVLGAPPVAGDGRKVE
jgi:mannose-6-phosphate isomerase-like protein (cupin superfamily)